MREEDEAFAAQFVPHGLRVLPLIWSDCAAHPRPLAAFRRIMEEPSRFIAEAISRAHANNFSGFGACSDGLPKPWLRSLTQSLLRTVLDWEPTGELTLADSHAFPRFISTFADAMHAATPPLTAAAAPLFLGVLAGQWLRTRISQSAFRRGLLLMLLVVGVRLIYRAVG